MLHSDLQLLQTSSYCNSNLDASSSVLQYVFASLVNSVSNVLVVSQPFLWHFRLGHVYDNKLLGLQSIILDVHDFHSNKDCIVCPIVKKKRLPFPSFNHLAQNAFNLIHCDVLGPFVQSTQEGFRYFLTIVDDATRSTWLYLMKSKTKTRPFLQSFYNTIYTQFNKRIKNFRTDNDHEFFMKDFFAANGITQQHSRVATPQQN